jgi:ParB-like chromosome segregation protein Spo0J
MKSLTPPLSQRRWAKANLLFEILPLASIKPNPHNARDHSPEQIDKLKRSLERFGFVTPPIIDDSNQLLCGHARLEAARQLRYAFVPVVRANHLSESEKRAFIIADNRLTELASWNRKSLRHELQFLSDLGK